MPREPEAVAGRDRRGLFITLEGGEGAGKSTQAARLAARLRGRGVRVVVTREPGGSPRAELIRAGLLAGRAKALGPFAETALFAAARTDHVRQLIRPALEQGSFVLCDRFTDSTRVYQGALAGVPPRLVAGLEAATVGPTRPDLTLILDLPAEAGLERARLRRRGGPEAPDRFEREGLSFHEGVRRAFLAIAGAEPERCRVVDATRGPDEVEARIAALVADALDRAGRAADGG